MESKQLCCVLLIAVAFFIDRNVYSIPVAELIKNNGSTSVVPLGDIDVNETAINSTRNGTRKDL